MRGDRLIAYLLFAAALFVVILIVAGCTSQPSCYETPRNMRCMSADQLEKELSK